ncbi:MAG: PD-(D/E)XK nuclease family protein [Flavobacteriales bacterium]|nr:PD-(D/E)XK nuclease family protein [Flavobacteriales bacterium]
MQHFLQDIADFLIKHSPHELEKTIVLFPNRRAIQFLKYRLITRANQKPFILPKMYAIDDFVASMVPYTITDSVSINATLFNIFKRLGIQKESYDLFYSWGEMLIRDFEELDKYLANPEQVFRMLLGEKEIATYFAYLNEDQIKAIQNFWNLFNPDKISNEQSLFLALWKSLPDVYKMLNQELSASGKTYMGHAYRLLAENTALYFNRLLHNNSRFLIAGFNWMTPAEVSIFSFIKKHYQVSFYWDVDRHYTEPTFHEAGYFFRKYSSRFPSQLPPKSILNLSNKSVTFYNCSKFTVQVQQAAQIIREIQNSKETIAIILPDETRLPIVLAALTDLDELNVTMGIQIRNSQAASFVSQWLEILRYARKNGEEYFYHITQLNQFIQHPLIISIMGDTGLNAWNDMLNKLTENLIGINHFLNICIPLHRMLSPPTDGISLLIQLKDFFHDYIQFVFTNHHLSKNDRNNITQGSIQTELNIAFYQALSQLVQSCLENKLEFSVQTASRLIQRLLHHTRVPFQSVSTGRIQIMGFIESQCLDFDHIFILDFNEGLVPPGVSQGSYIPFSIRKGFGLPVPEDHYRMYAYFFYRLMHHCKTMHLFYNTLADGIISCEPSRFVAQIKSECTNIQLKELKQDSRITFNQVLSIEVPKTTKLLNALMRYTEEANSTYLTPSALNVYLDCRLKFYFRYIVNLQESTEITNEINHAIFGNLLHVAMHDIYSVAIQTKGTNELSKHDIKSLHSNIPSAINRAFHEVFYGVKRDEPFRFEGASLIAKNILKRYIESILQYDETCAPITLLRMEEKDVITLHLAGRNIRIGGKIDRLDISNDIVRVIDYKTGSSENKTTFNSIEQLFEFNSNDRPGYVFQVMLYAFIADQIIGKDIPIQPGLLFVRDSFKDTFQTAIQHKFDSKSEDVVDYRKYKGEIEKGLNAVIADLFNPEVPFSQTSNTQICKNCAYQMICRKDMLEN